MTQGSFRKCRERTRLDVGAAPSLDLAPIESDLASTCAAFARFHLDEDSAFRKQNADLYMRSRAEENRAEVALSRLREAANAYVPGRAYRPLRAETGLTGDSRLEPNFARVASAIAGQHIRVRCWSAVDWPRIERDALAESDVITEFYGLAWFGENATDLAPEVCKPLAELRYGNDRTPGVALALGVGVLAHEASHLTPAGEDVEARAECFGMQRIRRTANLLGASPALSAQLAAIYWQRIYPEDIARYRSTQCRNGGLLDLHPGNPIWP
jgi:hypothetical protein